LQEQAAKCNSPAFAPRKNFHWRLGRRTPQRIHRHLESRIKIPSVLRVQLFLYLTLSFEQVVISSFDISCANFAFMSSNSFNS